MSDDQMKTTVRVDSVADTSGIDKMIARINTLQAKAAKMAKTPSIGLADSLNASVKKARELGSVLAKNEQESATNLRRRLGAEKRIWTQAARETERSEKAQIAASTRVSTAKAKDAAALDRAARRDELARFADGARLLRAKVVGEKLAALEQTKASAAAAKAAERALVARFDFEGRMRRQRTREEAAAVRETANANREAARVEARTLADRERARAADIKRRASSWGDVRQGGQAALTRGREAYGGAAQIGRQVLVGTGAAVAAGIKGIAGRMAVDAAETSLKIFGDDSGRKFTSKRIAEIRKEWLDSSALETGNTSTEGLEAYTEINKAGIKSPKKNTQLLLKAGSALELDTGATAKLMGLIDRNLGAASTPARMKSVLNSIAVAAREDPTNSPEIIEGMRRGFGALSLGNLSPEHLAGLVSGAQSVGVQPGKAGTFISTLMKDLTSGSYAKGARGRDLNEAARALGFGSAKGMASSASTDSTGTILKVLERLERMPELQRSKVTNRLSQTQWSDEDLMLLQGLGSLKKTLGEIDNKKNANFLDDASNERMQSWEKQWARSKAIFGRFWESIGAVFDGIFNEINRYFYDSAKRYDFSRITTNVKSFLGGFVEGLGFKDVRSLLESVLGKPGETGQDRIEQFKAFGKGLAEGLRSIWEAVKGLMIAFSGGSTDPETIGRLTGKIIGLSVALLVLGPVVSVLGALASGVLAVSAALRVGRGILDLITKAPGAKVPVPEGATNVPKGGVPGVKVPTGPGAIIGGGAAILGLPIDPSKADKDRLMGRLGAWAQEQERLAHERTRKWEDPPARVQKQSAVDEDVRSYIHPASLQQGEVARGVERVAQAVEGLGTRLQLASFAGSLSGGGAMRASVGGTISGAAGLGSVAGSGGAGALLGATPGEALPNTGTGRRGIIGGGDGSVGSGPGTVARGSLAANQKEAYASARAEGLSETAARALVANMSGESLRNPQDHHWDRTHMSQGIVQWDPQRAAAIQKQFGKLPKDMTVSDQTRAAIWEMRTNKSYAPTWRALQGNDPGAMIGALVRNYERPGDAGRAIAERSAHYRGFNPEAATGSSADAGGGDVLGRMQSLRTVNEQCVSLAKAAVGSTESVLTWQKGAAAESGTLKPGTPVATFLDRLGRQSDRYAGGGTGTPGAKLDHAGVFESYIRDKAGKITGMNIAEQYAGSRGVHSKAYRFGEGFGEANASNYNAIRDRAGRYLGGNLNPMNRPDTDTADKDILSSTGWKKAGAEDLAAESPAEKLAKSAPRMSQGGGAAGGGAKVTAPITVLSNGNAEHAANQVQKRIQDLQDHHTQDRSYESI